MIRVELDEQTAVELHHGAGVLRDVLEAKGATEHARHMRDAQLAIAGALRAVGWVPAERGWTKRPTGRRR
jgi:hypothetical protein